MSRKGRGRSRFDDGSIVKAGNYQIAFWSVSSILGLGPSIHRKDNQVPWSKGDISGIRGRYGSKPDTHGNGS